MPGRKPTMPADTRSPSLKTRPCRRSGTDRRRGDGVDVYVIAMRALGDTVAATFVLKTAIDLLL